MALLPRALLAVCLVALFSSGCAPDPDAALRDAPALPEATGDPEDMEGLWWALSRDVPYRALRLDLLPTDDPDAWTGTWIAFSWRASDHAEALSNPSLPVAISARIERQEVIITGPAPQFDQPGTPNGDNGRWELRLRRVSPSDKPPMYSGIMVHGEYTDPGGVSVKLISTFEKWSG